MHILVKNIHKSYTQGTTTISVLKDVSLSLEASKHYALVGPSGCGKSTLLHLMGLLDAPTSGHILFDDQNVLKKGDKAISAFRAHHLGYVYQFHHLLPDFTALENTAMPLIIQKVSKSDALDRARAMLKNVGLLKRMDHLPTALSGGEQQRVAIARALIHKPSLLLADEPTGNLDPDTAKYVFQLMIQCIKDTNATFLMATHDLRLAQEVGAVLSIKEGHVTSSQSMD
jgi:lipoprotein-releasing system ATP-binding protein